ncbi:MAG TPA: glutathione peroxidase [Rectinemataceae bacterium]|nr:glutathione peroxidase [Rectinemataceae bacterium]
MPATVHDFAALDITGATRSLSEYRGKVLLIVNTASRCGFTPQYAGLQKLYETYGERGFTVLGFPCNQFATQEPGGEVEIASFCSLNYGVTFPLFSKIEVNGKGAHPLFIFLKDRLRGFLGARDIRWNFTKFLIGRDGVPIRRFPPTFEPRNIAPAIEAALSRP